LISVRASPSSGKGSLAEYVCQDGPLAVDIVLEAARRESLVEGLQQFSTEGVAIKVFLDLGLVALEFLVDDQDHRDVRNLIALKVTEEDMAGRLRRRAARDEAWS
jgi:hypothetical protein